MMQWMDGVLAKGDSVEFFHDEYRCPIFVKDLVNIVVLLANKWITGLISPSFGVFCLCSVCFIRKFMSEFADF